jgi:hypothetical protein
MARDAKTVAGWDFDRIIPCHGVSVHGEGCLSGVTVFYFQDVIESGGKAAWCEAFKWYLEESFKA